MKKAIIYTRVSSPAQKLNGHGLDGQELDCLRYINMMGYKYAGTFGNDAISGEVLERGGIDEMFTYIEETGEKYIVVIDDVKRWARDIEVHRKYKRRLVSLGCTLESPTFRFENTPGGEFIETTLVAAGELERKQNAIQVRNRQEARLLLGYWPFGAVPAGYKFINHPLHGKLLFPTEPNASIIREALEGFASDRFLTLKDVADFLQSKGFHTGTRIGKKIYIEYVKQLLTEIKYTGFIKFDKWNVPLTKGHHQALISYDTYLAIQEKLKRKSRTKYVKGKRDKDYPLRDYVFCSLCKKKLTASWPSGRKKKYPYYWCKNTSCPHYLKTIKKEDIELEFESILNTLQATQQSKELLNFLILDVLNSEKRIYSSRGKDILKGIKKLENNIAMATERIFSTKSNEVKEVFEEEIEKAAKQKSELQHQLKILNFDDFDELNYKKTCFEILDKPLVFWQEKEHQTRLLIPKLIFGKSLEYIKDEGFTKYNISPLFT